METVIRRIRQLELIFLRPISFTVVVFSHRCAQRLLPKCNFMRNLRIGPRHALQRKEGKMKNGLMIGAFSLLSVVAAVGWTRKPTPQPVDLTSQQFAAQ